MAKKTTPSLIADGVDVAAGCNHCASERCGWRQSAFSVPPFQFQQLEQKNIRTVLSSFDVLGPHSFTVAWTSARFRKDNPELYASFLDAVKEATSIIAADPKGTAQSWINDSGSKLPLEMVTKVVTGSGVEWTMDACRHDEIRKVHAPGRQPSSTSRPRGRTCSSRRSAAERKLRYYAAPINIPTASTMAPPEHDLEHRLQEWRVHVARADEGDRHSSKTPRCRRSPVAIQNAFGQLSGPGREKCG